MKYNEAVIEANKRFSENIIGRDEKGFCKYRLPLHYFAIHIVHDEGTNLFFESANVEKVEQFYFIYTEHHGVFVYDESDVLVYKYERANIDGED